jgi:hypothetical protein
MIQDEVIVDKAMVDTLHDRSEDSWDILFDRPK